MHLRHPVYLDIVCMSPQDGFIRCHAHTYIWHCNMHSPHSSTEYIYTYIYIPAAAVIHPKCSARGTRHATRPHSVPVPAEYDAAVYVCTCVSVCEGECVRETERECVCVCACERDTACH